MLRLTRLALVFALAISSISAQSLPSDAIQQLPPAERWWSHLADDLLPFWHQRTALGDPFGTFPTTRCDDGSLVNPAAPCDGVRGNAWLLLRQRYGVAQSRQVYTYGVAFHLTGDPTFLEFMKSGVDYIRANVVDRRGGGLATLQDPNTGVWGPRVEARNPQELAYGLLGMAFYYYLTRDPEVLPDILATKNYIFEKYYNPRLNALQWVLAPNGNERPDERRLVAQLDQMNAYLVMLAPILPEPHQTEWKQSLVQLSRLMIEVFYSPQEGLFFLSNNRPEDMSIATAATDFGHSIKAMWMIRMTGLMTGDQDLVRFAEENGRRVLERAYRADSGSWANGVLRGGELDINTSWWIYCELDQFAASLALTDPSVARYLPTTYRYWLDRFVDRTHGEVWNNVDGRTHEPIRTMPKQWPWKNGYHSTEHAMVAYLTTRQLHNQPATLYYAFMGQRPPEEAIRPYFYTGSIESLTSETVGGRVIWKADFRDLK